MPRDLFAGLDTGAQAKPPPQDLFQGVIDREPRDLLQGLESVQESGAKTYPLPESSPIVPAGIPEQSLSMSGTPAAQARTATTVAAAPPQQLGPNETPYKGIIRRNVEVAMPLDLKGVAGKDSKSRKQQLAHLLDLPALEKDFGLPKGLLAAQITAESGWNPKAVGPQTKYGTAKGLSQFIDATAKQYGISDPFDPVQSVRGQAAYMADLLKRFKGDTRKALAAYNAGPGRAAQWEKKGIDFTAGIPYKETRNYVAKILKEMGAR